MYTIKKYGESISLAPMKETQAYFTLSKGFLKLSARKQAKMYKAICKSISNNPCSIKDAEVMFAIYSDEPHGNKVAKLLDKAGVSRYDEAEKGIGIKEVGPDDNVRTAHWFHLDIPYHEPGDSPKLQKKISKMMHTLVEKWAWGDYRFYIEDNEITMGGEVVVGGLHHAEMQELETAAIWIDFDGTTIAEFDTNCFEIGCFRNLHIYDKRGIKAIAKAVKNGKFKTADELGIS